MVGWLPRRVRTDGRVKLSGTMVRAGYEPCTFEKQSLFENHSQHTFDRRRRPARDGQSGLPSTTLDYVSVTELSLVAHVTAAAVGVCWHHPLSEHHRLEPFHWCRRTCPHE